MCVCGLKCSKVNIHVNVSSVNEKSQVDTEWGCQFTRKYHLTSSNGIWTQKFFSLYWINNPFTQRVKISQKINSYRNVSQLAQLVGHKTWPQTFWTGPSSSDTSFRWPKRANKWRIAWPDAVGRLPLFMARKLKCYVASKVSPKKTVAKKRLKWFRS